MNSNLRERFVSFMKFRTSIFMTILLLITVFSSVFLLEACGTKEKKDVNLDENVDKEDLDKEKDHTSEEDGNQDNVNDEEAVRNIVTEFGSKLQAVSLLAGKKEIEKSMKENYGDLVTEELLKDWIDEPIEAPGRLTSSPWPDRIEISEIKKLKKDTYQVKGEIIEITSEEKEKNDAATRRSIALIVKNFDGRLLIDDVTLGSYENTNQIIYENKEYGFRFHLPKSWKGYMVVTDKWEGVPVGETEGKTEGEDAVESGPIFSIRHPKWTKEEERQDIPIMIFTPEQWDALQADQFHIGAAPMNPSELGRNSKYVFALPARYNYAFPTGYEEVEDILEGKPLEPTEDFKSK